MTANELAQILVSRGCEPLTQHGCHELRDAVHETVHVLQCDSRTYEREALHRKLCRKADHDHITLVGFELQARAVEMLACKHFGIPYDIEHWVFITWMETIKSIGVNIGDLEDVRGSVIKVSTMLPARRMLERVLTLKPKRPRTRLAGRAL